MNNLLVSMLDLAGVPGVESFGDSTGKAQISDRTLNARAASSRLGYRRCARRTFVCSTPSSAAITRR